MSFNLKNKKISCLLILTFSSSVFSAASSNHSFPLKPRTSLWASSGSNSYGEGDAMIPLWGNPNQTFYGDISSKYGENDAWFASAGFGARKIVHNTIFGGYLFTDYNKTPLANYFTVLNPGVEFMTNAWDGHVNGYFPVSNDNQSMGVFTGDQLGIPNTTYFSGHTQYSQLFDKLENVGPGFDFEIGRTVNVFSHFKRMRIFAGSYYFSPQYTPNINGIEAGLEVPRSYALTPV